MAIEETEFKELLGILQERSFEYIRSFTKQSDTGPLHFQDSKESMALYFKKWGAKLGDDDQWSADAAKALVGELFQGPVEGKCLLVRKLERLSQMRLGTKVFYGLEKNETGFGLALVSFEDIEAEQLGEGSFVDLSQSRYNSLGIVPITGFEIAKYTFATNDQAWLEAYLDFCLSPIVLKDGDDFPTRFLSRRLISDPVRVLDIAAASGVEESGVKGLELGLSNMIRLSRHFMTLYFMSKEAKHLGEDNVRRFLEANTAKVPVFSHEKFNVSRLLVAAETALKAQGSPMEEASFLLRTCTVVDVGIDPETIGIGDETSTVAHTEQEKYYIHRDSVGVREMDFEGNKTIFKGLEGVGLEVSVETDGEQLAVYKVVKACNNLLSSVTGHTYVEETYKVFCAQNLHAATKAGYKNYQYFLGKVCELQAQGRLAEGDSPGFD